MNRIMTKPYGYGIYAGSAHMYEVWSEDQDRVKLEKISDHDTSDAAHKAKRRYIASDKRRERGQ